MIFLFFMLIVLALRISNNGRSLHYIIQIDFFRSRSEYAVFQSNFAAVLKYLPKICILRYENHTMPVEYSFRKTNESF